MTMHEAPERISASKAQDSHSRWPLQRKCPCGKHTVAGGECAACEQKQMKLQRRAANQAEPASAPLIVHEALRSRGQPLEPPIRAFMESRFGHDFSRVRVHTDPKAAESAQAVNALAYTVGRNVVFGTGKYAPTTASGLGLLAHELTHVVQQSGGRDGLQAQTIESAVDPGEREAEGAARAILAGERASIQSRASANILQRAKGDVVAYSGGPSGRLTVLEGGKLIFSTRAISGHPGSKEFEKNVGPIPTGTYVMHPQKTRAKVTRLERGVCGANAIRSGYQEITSDDPSPCSDPPSHYCTVSCPTAENPSRKCFTPRGCWGSKRMKIEGAIRVPKPTGGKVTRNGFYIHGGDHSITVTSGCVKVFDDTTFTHIRKLKGHVPFCVGSACPPSVAAEEGKAAARELGEIGSAFLSPFERALEAIWGPGAY